MLTVKRLRLASAVVLAGALMGTYVGVTTATADAGSHHRQKSHSGRPITANKSGPSVTRFNLDGYVINATYTLGRNTGNTFQQTYSGATVQGVPVAGPDVGVKFPQEDYVALPIGNHELYVAWQDPASDAIVDVFVMNFKTHVVFDYAPGSSSPESSGTITVVTRGAERLP